MLNLVKNESVKLLKRPSTYIMIALIVVGTILFGFLTQWLHSNSKNESNNDWKQGLQQDIELYEQEYENTNEEWYKNWMESQIAINQYRIENDIPPSYVDYSMWSFIDESSLMITFVGLFVIIIASGIVANEYSRGTIKMLLVKPYKRWKILLSKYITINLYSLFLLFVLIVSGYIIGSILFENGSFSEKTVIETYIQGGQDPIITTVGAQFVKGILLYLPSLLIINTISFMLSTLFKNQSLAVGVGIFVLFLNSVLGAILFSLLDRYEWFKYIIFPHLDLQIYLYGNNFYDLLTLPFSLTILAVYYIIFMVLTFTYFQKRDITF